MTPMAARTGLIVVDMLNTYEHEDAEPLTQSVEQMVEPLSGLIARAREDGVELIYVNDNYGDWNSATSGSWCRRTASRPSTRTWRRLRYT
jgi:nicotinamidase-related amidase